MPLTRICEECGGEGRLWRSRWGGNDPNVWDAGPCDECDDGVQTVLCDTWRCGLPATEVVTFPSDESETYCETCAIKVRENAEIEG